MLGDPQRYHDYSLCYIMCNYSNTNDNSILCVCVFGGGGRNCVIFFFHSCFIVIRAAVFFSINFPLSLVQQKLEVINVNDSLMSLMLLFLF